MFSNACIGNLILLITLEFAARWMKKSFFLSILLNQSLFLKSAIKVSSFISSSHGFFLISIPVTSYPLFKRYLQRCVPIKPLLPVTTNFIIDHLL